MTSGSRTAQKRSFSHPGQFHKLVKEPLVHAHPSVSFLDGDVGGVSLKASSLLRIREFLTYEASGFYVKLMALLGSVFSLDC